MGRSRKPLYGKLYRGFESPSLRQLIPLLQSLASYFWRYRLRLIGGLLFVTLSNYFNVLFPQVTGFVVDYVQRTLALPGYQPSNRPARYDGLVQRFVEWVSGQDWTMTAVVTACGLTILVLALLRGFFLFLMRQTLIVMSRHIEYAQKADIYAHFQKMDLAFYKRHRTGDLMNRISEDVARVRMFTGPALMYFCNLFTIILFCVVSMYRREPTLTLYVLSPLPLLAIIMYRVNDRINRMSEQAQASLSQLTVQAQETYSGIRVVKSFVQERSMGRWFAEQAESYRCAALGLAKVESLYFPSISLLIGISTLLTILMGGLYVIQGGGIGLNTLVEFILYINMLTFPVSAIGLTASLTQRAAASQLRIDELLQQRASIDDSGRANLAQIESIEFQGIDFVYPDSGVQAAKQWNIRISAGERVLIMGSTGSGKSTFAQLLMRMYDPTRGGILINGQPVKTLAISSLRKHLSLVPQDSFLFSDTIESNLRFGHSSATKEELIRISQAVSLHEEVARFADGYQTLVGERGVTLSGGQKQRLALGRALLKPASFYVLDDCLSAVDVQTENRILQSMESTAGGSGWILITHRVPMNFRFDRVIWLEGGEIVEQGTVAELISAGGRFATQYASAQAAARGH